MQNDLNTALILGTSISVLVATQIVAPLLRYLRQRKQPLVDRVGSSDPAKLIFNCAEGGRAKAQASTQFEQRIYATIAELPAPLRCFLHKHGVRFAPVTNICALLPELASQRPCGYRSGTYANISACYYSARRLVILAETDKDPVQFLYTFEHELGHAVDHALGVDAFGSDYYSSSPQYMAAFTSDINAMDPAVRRYLEYFVRLESPTESFAEIYNSVRTRWRYVDIVESNFNQTAALVKKRLLGAGLDLQPNRDLASDSTLAETMNSLYSATLPERAGRIIDSNRVDTVMRALANKRRRRSGSRPAHGAARRDR